MILDAYRALTGKVSKSAKQGLYKNGFFFASGIFAGIGLNDVFRLTNSDVNYEPLMIAGHDSPEIKDVRMDEVYQYAIVAAIVALSIATGKYVREVIPMSAGAITGIAWANKAERGNQSLSILPF